jgi:hypothetical protein
MDVKVSDWVSSMNMSRLLASALQLPMDMPMKRFLDDEIYQNQPDKSKARDEALRDYLEQKHNAALEGPGAHDYRLQRSVFLTRGLGHEKKLNFIEQIIDSMVSLQVESKEPEEEKDAASGPDTDNGESDVSGAGDVSSDNGESDVTGAGDLASDNGESDVTGAGDEEQGEAVVPMDVEHIPPEFDDDGKELEFKDYEKWEAGQQPQPPPSPPQPDADSETDDQQEEMPHAVPPARVVQGYSYSLGHPSELGFGPGRPGYARRVARTSKIK